MRSFDIVVVTPVVCGGLLRDRFANCSAGQVPNVVYYSKVGVELSKLVFKGQHMTPP
jgi:hypothetical protein